MFKISNLRKQSLFKSLVFQSGLLVFLFFVDPALKAQTTPDSYIVNGVVKSSQGETLIGVNVLEEGTDNGTITDLDGRFQISVSGEATLVFRYVGFITQRIGVNGKTTLDVVLQEGQEQLDEFVVVGYGRQRKKDLTGAIGVVNTDEMKKTNTPDIGQALQGMATGVNVTTSGLPGAGADINIRGIGSFSNVSPLYVVDGVIMQGSQREFSMNDVESIQILKDAAAAALYGARGANGVILITTKKGKDGKTNIDFNASYGVSNIAKRLEMMNSLEFLRTQRIAYENAGLEWPGEPQQGQILTNTDWQNEFFKTGVTQDYNLNVSGGNTNGRYFFSFNYYDQDGVVIGPSHKRFNIRSNTEAKKGIFTVGENLTFGRSISVPMIGVPFVDLALMPPIIPVRDPDNPDEYGYGNSSYPTYGSNPIGLQETRDNEQYNNRLLGNAYLQMEPIKGLQIKTNIGIEYFNYFDRYKTTYKQLRYLTIDKYETSLQENNGDVLTWIWENTVFYQKRIGKHNFDALLGYTAQKTMSRGNTAIGYNLATEGLWVLDQTTEDQTVSGSDGAYAMTSILGRINYNYNDRYLTQINIRRDGSSRFGEFNRFGYFPSASFGWRISQENFMESVDWVDDLKLRASYGILGDQQAVGNYAYATYIYTSEGAIFGTGDQTYYPGKIQKGRSNPNLKWEEKKTFNLGLDFTLLNQRLYGTVEYFDAELSNLLITKDLAWISGTDVSPITNYGAMSNKGFEFQVGFRDRTRDFKYDVSLNLSAVRNKVQDLANDDIYYSGINGVSASEVGHSIGEFYVLRTDGIFQNTTEVNQHTTTVVDEATGEATEIVIQPDARPGDIRYLDLNQDGVITNEDREYIGSPFPKFEGGLNFNSEYKGFDLNVFLYGVYGNLIYNNVKVHLESMNGTTNYPEDLQPWKGEGTSNTTPRPYIGQTDNTIAYSDRWIEHGDYLRLKNIQLGYSLSDRVLKKMGNIEKFRLYVSAQNVFTLTGYSGFDPEISGGSVFSKGYDDGHFPPVRTISGGLQVSF
ncbi:SusC/RagA family TonB-linked outer membrane protein [Saccharicrinis sp. FJH62]|uniref:SusC/RagA family TonB-linked outer membrane protein n=1 Tax=Saccharicrinis sp. FJH62 TaxID=3344657 RepID=UPI0035D512E4